MIQVKDGNEIYGSKCAIVDKVMQGNNVLQDPYECDPTDNNNPCKLFFGSGEKDYIETPCHCAIDGTNKGYCKSVLGTEAYKNALVPFKYMLERSECHTLDRTNFRAQIDCNTGTKREKIKEAVDAMFKVDHWPYMHSKQTRSLMHAISINSWENIFPDGSARLLTGISALASAAAVYVIS